MCEGVVIAQEIILELESLREEVGVSQFSTPGYWRTLRSASSGGELLSTERLRIFRTLPGRYGLRRPKRFVERLFLSNGKPEHCGQRVGSYVLAG